MSGKRLQGLIVSNAHTPGPWQAVEWSCHAATTIKAGDIVIAECSGAGRYINESLADARLIAAAPDLLAFAQSLVDAWESNEGMPYPYLIASAARAAINKATGEPS